MVTPLMVGELPPNATLYERTLADQVNQILALDTDSIRSLWNPWTCPIELLPYLAWAMSVDLWDPQWGEAKRRKAVAESLQMHRLKGTQAGIEAYLDLVDAKLIRATVPPATTYATGGFKDDQTRLDWLAGLPQVRIYPFLTNRTAPAKRAFYSRPGSAHSFYRDTSIGHDAYMQASDGLLLAGQKAFYVQDGIETPASLEFLTDTEGNPPRRIALQTSKPQTNFYGKSFFSSAYMQETKAESNVVVVNLTQDSGQRFSVPAGSTVTDVTPLRVNQTRIAPKGRGFLGSAKRQKFMLTSNGPKMVYDQISILSGPLLDLRKKTKSFYGFSRFGIAPFTAELAIQVPMKRPRSRFGKFYTGFMQKANMQPVYSTLDAIHVSKSLRDTVLVDTEIYRTVQLSDGLTLGTFKLGEMIKVK